MDIYFTEDKRNDEEAQRPVFEGPDGKMVVRIEGLLAQGPAFV
jgi:hypothetical protein